MTTVVYLQNALAPVNRSIQAVADNKPLRTYDPQWQTPYIALLNGQPILRKDWDAILNKDDILAFVDADAIPQGGGKSNPLRVLLMVAVAVYAPQLASGMLGSTLAGTAAFGSITFGQIATAAIGMVGNALVNALVPPPKMPSANRLADASAPSPTYSLQAQGNSARLDAAIPEHFGRVRVFPDFASQPYQEYANNDQFTFHLLSIGRGEYALEEIKIEDTPIANFNEIEYEVIQPGGSINLFPSSVISSSEVSGQEIIKDADVGPFIINPAGTVTKKIGIDFIAPKGIFYANDDGGLDPKQIEVQVWGRLVDNNGTPIGGGAFINLTAGTVYGEWSQWTTVTEAGGGIAGQQPKLITEAELPASTDVLEYRLGTKVTSTSSTYTTPVQNAALAANPKYQYQKRTRKSFTDKIVYRAKTGTPQRYSQFFNVTEGRWEIFTRRIDEKKTSSRFGHEIVWAGVRAYQEEPNNYGDVTLLALKMKATNNLSNQSARKVNLVATRKLPVWNGSTWSANTATRSIAWAFAYACKQIGLTDAQIDLATLLQLDATWAARGDYFDGRFDNFISFWEAATQILLVGRAKPFMQGGVMRAMRDQAQSLPVALYSMRNIVKDSFSIDYLMPTEDTADCIDVGYFDKTYWAQKRVRAKLPTATTTKPAKIELFGVTERDQAFREGMYQAASNQYRRKVIKFATEMEGFIPSMGDLIAVQHDMPGWGQHAEAVAWNAGTKELTVSEPLVFGTGSHYIGLRKRDGGVDGPILVTAGADAYKIILAVAPSFTPYVGQAEERTHIAFGASTSWRQLARVVSVTPRSLHQVEIQCVNEDSNVHTAELGQYAPAFSTSNLPKYTASPVVTNVLARPVRGDAKTWLITFDNTPWADDYVIQQSSDEETWTETAITRANNIIVTALYDASTIFRVAARGNSTGPWIIANNDTTPPENVEAVTVEGNKIVFSRSTALDLDGYRIRFHYGLNTNWETAAPLHEGLVLDSPYEPNSLPAGTVTFLVKAVDWSKNESLVPATTTINLGDALVDNVISIYNYETDAYAGTVTGASIDGSGNLAATNNNDFYGTDGAVFYGNSDDDFYVLTYDPVEWVSEYYLPSALAIGQKMTLDFDIIGGAYSVYYRVIGTADFYGTDSADFYGTADDFFYGDLESISWQAWRGQALIEQGWYQFKVTITGGSTQGSINDFMVVVDMPDKNLILNGIALSAGGTRLSGAVGQFTVIQNIQLTLRGGSTATYVEASDYANPLGPLAQAKDSTGTGVSATIDAHIQGY